MYLFRCDFTSCSESTEIWHADSFCVKKCPVIFSRRQNNMDKIARKSPQPPPPPLCPSPNNVGFWSLRAQTLCVCVLRYWRAGGLSRTCFKAPCPRTLIWPLICSLAVVVLILLKVHPKLFCCRVLYCFQFIQLTDSCILLLYYMYACSDLVSIILHQVTVLYN